VGLRGEKLTSNKVEASHSATIPIKLHNQSVSVVVLPAVCEALCKQPSLHTQFAQTPQDVQFAKANPLLRFRLLNSSPLRSWHSSLQGPSQLPTHPQLT